MSSRRMITDTDRITDARWDSQGDGGLGASGLSGFVFTRDALEGYVPIGGHSLYREDFRIRVEDDSAEDRERVMQLFGRDRYGLTDAACDLIEEIGNHLSRWGEVAYELVSAIPSSDPASKGSEAGLVPTLAVVPALTLKAIGSIVIQLTPRVARARRFQFVRVPASKLFRVALPSELGSPRQHRRMLRKLARVERATRRLDPVEFPKGYDMDAARRANDAETIRLSRRWGVLYFMRPQKSKTTSYFDVAGMIAHRHAQALVREHVVGRLNMLLHQQHLPELVVDGLPTSAEIEEVIELLQAGEIDFKQADERTRW